MKCPNCGNEIPDGSLFCEKCAAEIKIVPEYETGLEEQISRGMASITKVFDEDRGIGAEDSSGEDISEPGLDASLPDRYQRYEKRRRRVTMMLVFIVGAVSALVVMIAALFGARSRKTHDASYYVGRAYLLASEERYEDAANEIDQALALDDDEEEETSNASLYLLKSQYLLKAGEKDLALGAASLILDDPYATEEDDIAAYGQMISIYASYEEYDKIAELLANCTRPSVVRSFPQYALFDPVFSLEEGTYEDTIYLELSDEGEGSIFYTLDGSVPTTSSMLYKEPIRLSEGTTTVSAIYVNHFGLESNVVTRTYVVQSSVPDVPIVSPNSGTYAKQMQITAVAQDASEEEDEDPETGDGDTESDEEAGEENTYTRPTGKIYYTTDGTDPTLDSYEYTGSITMPEGSSVYRFAVITEDGISSEVVEREYTYKITTTLSKEDGVNYILIALINRGEVVDTIGTIPSGTAQFTFTYIGLEQIGNSGNYLVYEEALADIYGNTVSTGRTYAVNAANGTVNLYADGVLTPIG